MAQICFIQWREPYDDEDNLSIYAYPDSEYDEIADIREEFGIEEPENPEAVDEEGCIIVPNCYVLHDGDILEHKGRTFRVTIEEITDGQ